MVNATYAVPHTGKTILDYLWEDLIATIDNLMADADGLLERTADDHIRDQGRAEGVAWSIAVIIMRPNTPDINVIKAEAMERWEAMQ